MASATSKVNDNPKLVAKVTRDLANLGAYLVRTNAPKDEVDMVEYEAGIDVPLSIDEYHKDKAKLCYSRMTQCANLALHM